VRLVVASGITLACLACAAPAAADITFTRDVAPVIFERCSGCHRPGEIGPFSLLSYRDVRQRATQIADVTSRRVMPPWKPEPPETTADGSGGELFLDSRRLTDREIALIRGWLDEGAVEGDPGDLPAPPPSTTAREEWRLGVPDLIVLMTAPYVLRASGQDVFRTFVIPIPTDRARYVRGLEFKPGNARIVHHANIGVDRTQSSRRLDAADPEPGYVGGMVPDAGYPPGHMLGWTPGQHPRPSPSGMPWRLEAKSDLVVQLHLQPTGKPESLEVSVGLFFTDEPPTGSPVGLRLGSQTIDIPAGAGAHQITDSYRLPVDADLLAIQPHAHNLGRRVEAEARLPDATTRRLISIEDWDFRWQDVYRYAKPIALPAGTVIAMRFTYDNSAANPRNPHRPPTRVVWGQNTSDEMGDLWLQLVPRRREEFGVLATDVTRKTRAEDLAAYTKLAKEDAANPLRYDAVATLYLQDGRPQEAAAFLTESLRLNSASAPTHYNLGLALSMMRRFLEAEREFQEAVGLDPAHADAFNNLGAMRHVTGDLEGAAAYYRRATTLRPDNAEARNNLGRVLSTQGQDAAAVDEFRAALALRPDMASALSGLAWVLATSSQAALRDPAGAIQTAERAVALTGRSDATALDALAAAYGAAGRFDLASASARAAVDVATRAGAEGQATQIRTRLAAYEAASNR
jgi:Flp pilus assembly protein TadD